MAVAAVVWLTRVLLQIVPAQHLDNEHPCRQHYTSETKPTGTASEHSKAAMLRTTSSAAVGPWCTVVPMPPLLYTWRVEATRVRDDSTGFPIATGIVDGVNSPGE